MMILPNKEKAHTSFKWSPYVEFLYFIYIYLNGPLKLAVLQGHSEHQSANRS